MLVWEALSRSQPWRELNQFQIINVVGIVFGPSLGFIFPCYFDLICVRRRAYDRTKLEVAISIIVLCVSVAATFLGFGQQVVGLVRAYINGSDDDRR